MKIAILGGTGPQGQGLALRFASVGIDVAVGSRDKQRAETAAKEMNSLPMNKINIKIIVIRRNIFIFKGLIN